jgi:hypothetical protein
VGHKGALAYGVFPPVPCPGVGATDVLVGADGGVSVVAVATGVDDPAVLQRMTHCFDEDLFNVRELWQVTVNLSPG